MLEILVLKYHLLGVIDYKVILGIMTNLSRRNKNKGNENELKIIILKYLISN